MLFYIPKRTLTKSPVSEDRMQRTKVPVLLTPQKCSRPPCWYYYWR